MNLSESTGDARVPDAASPASPLATRSSPAIPTPLGLAIALLVFGLADSAQLYLFEHFRGDPVSVAAAMARNLTFWVTLVPFTWGLLRWLSKPVSGGPGRRLLVHAAVAFGAGLVHIALWVVAREILAHGHFRLDSYPVLVAKFAASRLWLDLAIYGAVLGLVMWHRSSSPGSRVQSRDPSVRRPSADGSDVVHEIGRLLLQQNGGEAYLIDPDRLEWVEASGDYMRLHLEDDEILVRITLTELDRRLDDRFVRVNRSALVCIDRVRQVRPSGRDRHEVVLDSGTRVTLTASYRDRFRERLPISL